MNRREFGKMVLGTGATAALPGSVMAGATAATAQRSKYIFAVALAHAHIDVSASDLVDKFRVTPSTARQLMAKLVRNGVVDPPNAAGISRLAESLQRIIPQVVEHNPAGGYLVKGPLEELTAKAKEAARDTINTDAEGRINTSSDHNTVAKAEPPFDGSEASGEETNLPKMDRLRENPAMAAEDDSSLSNADHAQQEA